jgi:ribosomal protein S18 acetylase RimI-like enzyme
MILQLDYQRLHPKSEIIDEKMLLSPVYGGGENVICALDNNGKLVGYVPVAVHLVEAPDVPHLVWANMVISPDVINPEPLRDLLLKHAIQRAREITSSVPSRIINLAFQYHISETESIEYVVSRGAIYTDSVLRMVRDLTGDIIQIPAPENIEVRYWRIETEEELKAYVEARNEAFVNMPVTVEDWQHFLFSVVGDSGTTVAAFDEDKVVGAVSAYWSDAENRLYGVESGWTENVFVLAPWRGRGIVESMISMALTYLKEHGLKQAQLDPGVSNQRAIHVYKRLGFEITDESQQFILRLS